MDATQNVIQGEFLAVSCATDGTPEDNSRLVANMSRVRALFDRLEALAEHAGARVQYESYAPGTELTTTCVLVLPWTEDGPNLQATVETLYPVLAQLLVSLVYLVFKLVQDKPKAGLPDLEMDYHLATRPDGLPVTF